MVEKFECKLLFQKTSQLPRLHNGLNGRHLGINKPSQKPEIDDEYLLGHLSAQD